MIVTFLAILEMIRLKLVRVFQAGVIGPIRVYKRARPADAPSFGRAQDGPERAEGSQPPGDRGAIPPPADRTIEAPAERTGDRQAREQDGPTHPESTDEPITR